MLKMNVEVLDLRRDVLLSDSCWYWGIVGMPWSPCLSRESRLQGRPFSVQQRLGMISQGFGRSCEMYP